MTLHPLTGTNALIFALGLGLMLAGAHLLLHSSQLRRRGRHTWGTANDTDSRPARSRVTFRTTDGELVTVSSRYRLAEGAAVPLYYDPEQPTYFAIDSQLYRRGPYLLIGLGLGIVPLAWLF